MIRKILKFNEINTTNWSKHCLLLLDIDETIIIPREKVMRDVNYHNNGKRFIKSMRDNLGEIMVDQIFDKKDYIFVDKEFPLFIKKMVEMKIPYISLTARRTGEASPTSGKAEDILINDLNKLNIKFDPQIYPNNTMIKLSHQDVFSKIKDDLLPFYRQNSPMIKSGIIFCCNINKDEILTYYLYQVIEKPKKIIVIDDKITNLERIKSYCEKENLEYELYHFIGEDLLDNDISNEEVDKRIEYMLKHKIYISE
jgi:hypothetical protein